MLDERKREWLCSNTACAMVSNVIFLMFNLAMCALKALKMFIFFTPVIMILIFRMKKSSELHTKIYMALSIIYDTKNGKESIYSLKVWLNTIGYV